MNQNRALRKDFIAEHADERKPVAADFLTVLIGVAVGFFIERLVTSHVNILHQITSINDYIFFLPLLLISITILSLVEHWRMYSVVLRHPPLALQIDLITVIFAMLAVQGFFHAGSSQSPESLSAELVQPAFLFGMYLTFASIRFVWHLRGQSSVWPDVIPLMGNGLGAIMGFFGYLLLLNDYLSLTLFLACAGVVIEVVFVVLIELLIVAKSVNDLEKPVKGTSDGVT